MESMYRNLSEVVPHTALDQGMMIPTRLQTVDGKLPYLPCQVKLYHANQLRHCLIQRNPYTKNDNNTDGEHHRSDLNPRGSIPTWVAFVGDSKMRDKFNAIVFGLRTDFNWSTSWDPKTNGLYVPVSMEELENAIAAKVMVSMRAVSTDNLLKVDFIWSSRGLVTDGGGTKPVPLLNHWATLPEDVPHLIVMGRWMSIGLWTFKRSFELKQNFLAPYDAILKNWMQTTNVLASLAARTNVLVWPQGRKRDFVVFDRMKKANFSSRDILYEHMLSKQALEWIEKAMHESLKNTGVTLWDSL
ncbi:unnamed protein product, partial [Meganyctiphanes norvegica]